MRTAGVLPTHAVLVAEYNVANNIYNTYILWHNIIHINSYIFTIQLINVFEVHIHI